MSVGRRLAKPTAGLIPLDDPGDHRMETDLAACVQQRMRQQRDPPADLACP